MVVLIWYLFDELSIENIKQLHRLASTFVDEVVQPAFSKLFLVLLMALLLSFS